MKGLESLSSVLVAVERRTLLVIVAALCSFFAMGASVASAAYIEAGSFAGGGPGPGGTGSGDGQLDTPGQADVNDATGYLYVADTGNDRVQVFKPTATGGEYDSQAAVPGAVGLAIDQAIGDVYVATGSGVSKFDEDLNPIASGWTDPGVSGPLAVDPSTGDLLVADTAANLVRRFNGDGTADGTFAAQRPIDLAADSTGDVLVITSTGDVITDCNAEVVVRRFSGAGVEEGQIGASPGAPVPGAVAVDPDDDSVVVASRVNQWHCGADAPLIKFFAADGTALEEFALPSDTVYAMVPGLAVQGDGSSRVYAVTRSPYPDEFGATKVTALEVPPPTAPEVVGQSALRDAQSATLQATIDPGGDPTTYRFEYGTTPAYGQSTPEGSLPASFEPSQVSASIDGLQPDTTYHYRVVAENSIDEVQGPDRTFTTSETAAGGCPNEAFRSGASAHLTECRAWELVTPTDSQANIRVIGGPVTPDGNVVCFNSEDPLAGSDPNGIKIADDGFCAWRTASGWETKWVTGPAPVDRHAAAQGGNVYFLSPDGRRIVFASDAVIFGNDWVPETGGSRGAEMSSYMWEGGETTWLAPPGIGIGNPPAPAPEPGSLGPGRRPLAASADLSRGVFMSQMRIVPEDENALIDLYEWHPGGVRLVSADSSGKAAGGGVGIQPSSFPEGLPPDFGSFDQQVGPPGTISADGSRIFFQHAGEPLDGDASEAPEGPDPEDPGGSLQSVYLREGDEVTLVSPRRGSGPGRSVWFVGAPADGSAAYLETTQQLTPEAKQSGRAIYRYDVGTDQLELVATAPGGVKFLTLSPDGSTIVYTERLTKTLFVERDGIATTLGTLSDSDIETEQGAAHARQDKRMLRVSPDGRVVVFAAAGEFAGFGPGPIQVYRWEAGEGLARISAVEGAAPVRDASIGAYNAGIGSQREELFANHNARANSGRVMSDDGSRVFFETPERLVQRDVNGATDVYEWHDGEISIVSSGTGGNSFYHGSSADGRTVFITTFDRLLPEWDRNAKRDVYVAQPGGGFPPPAPPPGCQGEACQPGRQAPLATPPGQGQSEGNLQRGLAKAKLVRGGKAIRVSVLAPGRVTAKLSGKLGKGKKFTAATASRVARNAGTLTLPMKLNRKARALLTARGRLRLTLTVTHVQSDQTITRKVTLHG